MNKPLTNVCICGYMLAAFLSAHAAGRVLDGTNTGIIEIVTVGALLAFSVWMLSSLWDLIAPDGGASGALSTKDAIILISCSLVFALCAAHINYTLSAPYPYAPPDCDTLVYGPLCDPVFRMDMEFLPLGDEITTLSLVIPFPYDSTPGIAAPEIAGMVTGIVDRAYRGVYSVRTENGDIIVNSMHLWDTGVDFHTDYKITRWSEFWEGRHQMIYAFFENTTGAHHGTLISHSVSECNKSSDYEDGLATCGTDTFYGEISDVTKSARGFNVTVSTLNGADIIIELEW